MKSIILCEGRTDFLFLQYFMKNVHAWEDAGKDYKYRAFLQGNRAFLKHGNELVIGFCGGSSKIPRAVDHILKINKTAGYADEKYDNLILVTDRDEDTTEDTIIRLVDGIVAQYALPFAKSVGGAWNCVTCKDVLAQKFSMKILYLVIPPTENGALETLLLNSIAAKDSYDAAIIAKGNTFVDTIDHKEKYLTKRRYKTKAKLNVYLSVRIPEFDFGRLHELYAHFPWQDHPYIQKALQLLKDIA